MIVDWKIGNVLDAPERHIVFPFNTEGQPGPGLDGTIADNIMPSLENSGPLRMGQVLSHEFGEQFFHALVVHSLADWSKAPEHIESSLNDLRIPHDSGDVATIAMGAGIEGQRAGANVAANLGALARSYKRLVVYSL